MYATAGNSASRVRTILNITDNINDSIQTAMKQMYSEEDSDEAGIKTSWTITGEIEGQPKTSTGTFYSRVTGTKISGNRYVAEAAFLNAMFQAVTNYEDVVGVGLLMEPGEFSKDIGQYA